MSIEQLAETALAMVAAGKGIIAIDESTATIAKRFAGVGIENSEENRRAYRELLLTTPNLSDYISGAILFDETLRQSTKAGVPFAKLMAENDRVLITSGDHMEVHGTTNTLRLLQVGAGGVAAGLGEL